MNGEHTNIGDVAQIEAVKERHLTRDELIALIKTIEPREGRPAFVAISGFGGSGKSTLALNLCKSLDETADVVPIDDFIVGPREQRSGDWQTFDRERLRQDVLERARVGKPFSYRRYNSGDWVNGRGGSLRIVTPRKILIIEGCSVIHPDLMPYYDCSVWVDCPQEVALANAKQRDQTEIDLFGDDDTDRLWNEFWGPNDRDYFETFHPDHLANVLLEPQF